MMGDQVKSLRHVCQIAERHDSTTFVQQYRPCNLSPERQAT